jgi:alcohol dehydrogenase, propanol-preferring
LNADTPIIVRLAGKIVCIGTLNPENTVYMKVGTRKRLSFMFSYGGQARDLKEVLKLISEKVIQPQVETGHIKDFPRVLQDLCDGKIKARVALLHD